MLSLFAKGLENMKLHPYIPANCHFLGVSLTVFEIKYDRTPDFSKRAKSHSLYVVSLLNYVCGLWYIIKMPKRC